MVEDMAHDHSHSTANAGRTRLIVVICITMTVFLAEVVGSIISGSLALLADAGHMLSDLIGLIVALVASIIASKLPVAGTPSGSEGLRYSARLSTA